ncbi:MAG: hypothetical protein M3Y08_01515 [Fibrobacterota bacterium]|nr:hypothetical protein [Fibrobacterota bacterium]
MKAVIHLQDPTFQGFQPRATEAGIWNLIQKQAEANEAVPVYGLGKRAVSTMGPNFALSLIGK